jgi:hypothetical protein
MFGRLSLSGLFADPESRGTEARGRATAALVRILAGTEFTSKESPIADRGRVGPQKKGLWPIS